ncbi:hypothetical protein [Winogradskyella tangerina]|uniref:hypothetical protein n=1 Tax=Winogradskyella tangerina TaxID=2023240 RepID=UPI000DBE7D81|nr:hypothetical protein [Winogradskyella tangerina]
MKKLFSFALLILFSTTVIAQEVITEGFFIAKQTLTTDDETIKAQLELMGDVVSTTYFKDSKSRVEVSNPMSGDVAVISDSETLQGLTLMDSPMLGKKYQISNIDSNNIGLENIKVKDGTETKTILGYLCKEKILTYKEGENELKMRFFTTDKIRPILNQQTIQYGDKIAGLPLYSEATVLQGDTVLTIITEVTELKAEKMDDSKFSMNPPEGYTEM